MASVRTPAAQSVRLTIGATVLGLMLGAYSVGAQARQSQPATASLPQANPVQAEHLRGTVTAVTGTTITIRTTDNQTRTVTIDAKTMMMKGDAHVTIKDVKVGGRIVVDVDNTTSVAKEIQLGTAAPAPAPRSPRSQPPS